MAKAMAFARLATGEKSQAVLRQDSAASKSIAVT